MRILHAISTLSSVAGGPPVGVLAMAKAVAALGHEVSIHASDHAMTDADRSIIAGVRDGGVRIVVHRHLPPGGLTRHASIGMWRSLAGEIPEVDVVHVHGLYGFHNWAVWRECRRASVPYIVTPHGALDPVIFPRHRWRKAVLETLYQNRLICDAVLIHFISEVERDLAQPFIFGRPGAIVPVGVDLERFSALPPLASFRALYPEIGNRRIVLFLGRLNFKKGLEILVPAFAAVAAQRDNIHLVLAGPDGGFEAKARALVKEHGIANCTTFTGHLARESVVAAYAAAYMFVLPSRTENFGLAPAEAMAAGIPSLLSERVGVAHAALCHGACRVVPLTVADWTAAILDLLARRDAAEALGVAAKSYARATFCWPTVAAQLVELYEQAVALAGR